MTTDHTFLVKGVAWKTSIYLQSQNILANMDNSLVSGSSLLIFSCFIRKEKVWEELGNEVIIDGVGS